MTRGILNDNPRVVYKGAQTVRCQIQQFIDYMAPNVYPSSKHIGDTTILHLGSVHMDILTWFLCPLVHFTPGIRHDCHFCKPELCDLDCTVPHMKSTRLPGAPSAACSLHDLMPTSLRENNEIYCDTRKWQKLWNLIYDVLLKIAF